MFDELNEVKYFKKIIRLNIFQEFYNEKYFKEIKHLKSLQNADEYLQPKWTTTMELFCEYT